MHHWYLIHTKPRSESVAETNLRRQGFHTYLPWLAKPCPRGHSEKTTVEPLFPRYLFVEVDAEEQSIAPIRSTYGVSRIVTFGGRLTPVSAELIDAIKRQAAADGLHCSPRAELKKGEGVRITAGPFAGLRGIFRMQSGRDRIMILLEILGKTTTVSIGRAQVTRLDSAL